MDDGAFRIPLPDGCDLSALQQRLEARGWVVVVNPATGTLDVLGRTERVGLYLAVLERAQAEAD